MAIELVIYVARQFGIKEYFLDEVASAKLNLHGDFLGSVVTLVCLRQSTRVSFMGQLDTPSFVSGLNAWIVVLVLSMRRIWKP